MRIAEAFPSTYLKAADLQDRNIKVVIDRTEWETVGEDRKIILYFKGKEKGLVLNKTNANNIAVVYGDDTDDWNGGEIILFSTMVDFQGKSVPAIRVKVPPQKPAQRQQAAARPAPTQEDVRDDARLAPAELDDEIPF